MIDPGLEIVGPAIAIVYVIGVLPHVDAEDRLRAVDKRVFAIRRLHHLNLAVLDCEPRPARAELRDAALDEVLFGLVDRAERILQRLFDFARDLASARLHPFPEMNVVIVLAGVVEHRGVLAERALDDLLKRLALPFGP